MAYVLQCNAMQVNGELTRLIKEGFAIRKVHSISEEEFVIRYCDGIVKYEESDSILTTKKTHCLRRFLWCC